MNRLINVFATHCNFRGFKLETFRFEDEDDYEYESFFAYSQNIDSPESFILPFLTRKVSIVIFS